PPPPPPPAAAAPTAARSSSSATHRATSAARRAPRCARPARVAAARVAPDLAALAYALVGVGAAPAVGAVRAAVRTGAGAVARARALRIGRAVTAPAGG